MKKYLRKIIIALVAGAMLAVSAGVVVVSAATALYGLLRESLGGPGAAATVALAAAALMAIVALCLEHWILRPSRNAGRERASAEEQDMMGRLIGLAREKPVVATGALIGATFLAMRNPALTALVVKAFLDNKPRPTKKA